MANEKKESKKKERLVRIVCTVEGHEDDWIEFDTAGWTLADMRQMFESSVEGAIMRWVEKHSTAWHLTGDDETVVAHPGRGASKQAWLNAYRQLGSEGLRLHMWLGYAPYRAAMELTAAPTKSEAGGEGVG